MVGSGFRVLVIAAVDAVLEENIQTIPAKVGVPGCENVTLRNRKAYKFSFANLDSKSISFKPVHNSNTVIR